MGIAKDFKYTTAEDSMKPNYLRNKFAQVRRELREKAERERAQAEATEKEINQKVRKMK